LDILILDAAVDIVVGLGQLVTEGRGVPVVDEARSRHLVGAHLPDMALELPQADGGGVDLVVGETGVRQRGTQAIGRHGADPARGVGID
jgi:hypothetical protein